MRYKWENHIEDLNAVKILSKVLGKGIASALMKVSVHENFEGIPDTVKVTAEFEDMEDGTTVATVRKFIGNSLDTAIEDGTYLIKFNTDNYTLQNVAYTRDEKVISMATFKSIENQGVKINTIMVTEGDKSSVYVEFDATNTTNREYLDHWFTQIPLFKPNLNLEWEEKAALDGIRRYIGLSDIDLKYCDKLIYSENGLNLWNVFFGVKRNNGQMQVSLYSADDCFFDVSLEQNKKGEYELLYYRYINTSRNNPPIHIYTDTEIKKQDPMSGGFSNYRIAYNITDRLQFFADGTNNSTTMVTRSDVSKENSSKEEFGFEPYTVKKLLSDPHFYRIANLDNVRVFNATERRILSEEESRCDIFLEVEEYKKDEEHRIIMRRHYRYKKDDTVNVSNWKDDMEYLVSEYNYFGSYFEQSRLKAPEDYSLKYIECEDDGYYTAAFRPKYILPGSMKVYYVGNTLVGDYKVTFPQNGRKLQHDKHYFRIVTKDQLVAEGARDTIEDELWISPISENTYSGYESISRKDKDGNDIYSSYESVSEEDAASLQNKVLIQAQVIIDSQDKTPKVK